MTSTARIRALEAASRSLAADAATRAARLARTARHSERFLAGLASRPVYVHPGERAESLAALAIRPQPDDLDAALGVLDQHVDGIGYNLGSSRFFAYIPSGSLYESALADYHAAVSNRYAGVGYAAPGAARMDEVVLRWLADLVGYPAGADGDLTSGGSMAALSAVVTAREAGGLSCSDIPQRTVYLTSETHHTFAKALRVAGLGECVVRVVALDGAQRMDVAALRERIHRDRRAGLRPWLVAASAGTTNTGAVDPLPDIAAVAHEHALWLHVDAAYGGAFALCAEGRRRLAGIDRADSLILDPHKGLFIPCGLGVVLVRDGRRLEEAFAARGIYMQDLDDGHDRSACDRSPELTRPFRALRLWLPLRVHGTDAFAAALEEKLLLAEHFHARIGAIDGVEVGGRPDLSVVPFRYLPRRGDPERFNRALLAAIEADGRVLMTSTMLGERYVVRFAILNYMTHLDDVDLAISVIEEQIRALRAT